MPPALVTSLFGGGDKSDHTSDTPEYIVQKIIKGRYLKRQTEYLIHWQGFSARERTWEPDTNLNAAARNYLAKYPVKMSGRKASQVPVK